VILSFNDCAHSWTAKFSSCDESSSKSSGWKTFESLKGSHPQSIALDLLNPSRAYCGTFDKGLWKTDNGGQTWDSIGKNEYNVSFS
jgi:hypothetical protein